MSKPRGTIDLIVRVVFLVLLALLTLSLGLLLLIFFVPVVGWYIWRFNDKNKELEERLAALEGPHKPKPSES
jgi:uncharacterized membrane protein